MNPYRALPIYTPSIVKTYFKKPINEVPPHVFALADAAYHNLTEEGKNQSLIISGESGAGKVGTNFLHKSCTFKYKIKKIF